MYLSSTSVHICSKVCSGLTGRVNLLGFLGVIGMLLYAASEFAGPLERGRTCTINRIVINREAEIQWCRYDIWIAEQNDGNSEEIEVS